MILLYILLLIMVEVEGQENQCSALVIYQDDMAPLKRFSVKEKSITVGNHQIKLSQDWNTLGVAGVLWDSAVILSDYLVKQNIVEGKRVLELGAGIGLPSIISVLEGAAHVTVTDQSHALPHLHDNLSNNLTPQQLVRTLVKELDWNNVSKEIIQDYDIIVGSDLVYNKEVFEGLRNTLLQYASPNTVVLMASKIRYPKDKRFYKSLEKNFIVKQVLYDSETDVTLFNIVKNNS